VGNPGQIETVDESRVEVIFPTHLMRSVLAAMHGAHPYQEVAHFVHTLENAHPHVGLGMVGLLPKEMTGEEFLGYAAGRLGLKVIRHTTPRPVRKVAVCGGTGASLLPAAIAHKADVLLTADFKYHQFFEGEGRIMIADIGHYESERFAGEMLADYLSPLFPEIQIRNSAVNTNPVMYFVA
jgi:putative NIF3 family GTP cyclohydrolase 1 type 2